MNKQEAIRLFKKLFIKGSRSRIQWKDLLDSLALSGDITPRQANKFLWFGVSPIDKIK